MRSRVGVDVVGTQGGNCTLAPFASPPPPPPPPHDSTAVSWSTFLLFPFGAGPIRGVYVTVRVTTSRTWRGPAAPSAQRQLASVAPDDDAGDAGVMLFRKSRYAVGGLMGVRCAPSSSRREGPKPKKHALAGLAKEKEKPERAEGSPAEGSPAEGMGSRKAEVREMADSGVLVLVVVLLLLLLWSDRADRSSAGVCCCRRSRGKAGERGVVTASLGLPLTLTVAVVAVAMVPAARADARGDGSARPRRKGEVEAGRQWVRKKAGEETQARGVGGRGVLYDRPAPRLHVCGWMVGKQPGHPGLAGWAQLLSPSA